MPFATARETRVGSSSVATTFHPWSLAHVEKCPLPKPISKTLNRCERSHPAISSSRRKVTDSTRVYLPKATLSHRFQARYSGSSIVEYDMLTKRNPVFQINRF